MKDTEIELQRFYSQEAYLTQHIKVSQTQSVITVLECNGLASTTIIVVINTKRLLYII